MNKYNVFRDDPPLATTMTESGSDYDDIQTYYFMPKNKFIEIRDFGDLFVYLKQNPRTFVATITFITSLAVVIVLGITYAVKFHSNFSYYMAGAVGIVSSLYGFCHFHTLLNLKRELDSYYRNNRKFAAENSSLRTEVKRFSLAKDRKS